MQEYHSNPTHQTYIDNNIYGCDNGNFMDNDHNTTKIAIITAITIATIFSINIAVIWLIWYWYSMWWYQWRWLLQWRYKSNIKDGNCDIISDALKAIKIKQGQW